MNDERSKRTEHVALFRYGLIADFLNPSPEDAGQSLHERMRQKAAGSYCIPGTRRTRPRGLLAAFSSPGRQLGRGPQSERGRQGVSILLALGVSTFLGPLPLR